MEQMPGEVNGFTPILTPALRPLFKQIPNGKVVKMYTLLYRNASEKAHEFIRGMKASY